MNIGLIGGGAMGEAIISAVISAKVAAPAQIKVYDVIAERTRQLAGAVQSSARQTARPRR